MKEAVVLVHGIWRQGREFWLLKRRLMNAGYDCYVFSYPSLRATCAENAQSLNAFVAQIDAPIVHFVCHSMGGIVLSHAFAQQWHERPGRVVFLGSPVRGSAVAQRLYQFLPTRPLLGKSIEHGLLGGAPEWSGGRQLGVIVGKFGFGIGTFVGGLEGPNDGTVNLYETTVKKAHDSILLPYSHTGLLYSREVAGQVITFLRAGKFGDQLTDPLLDASPT